MILAVVRGNVVSSTKSEKLNGYKLLVVVPLNIDTFKEEGSPFVSVDTVGVGEGEVVMIVGGSSSRQTELTTNRPVDSAIVAVIDSVNLKGEMVYEKFPPEKKSEKQK